VVSKIQWKIQNLKSYTLIVNNYIGTTTPITVFFWCIIINNIFKLTKDDGCIPWWLIYVGKNLYRVYYMGYSHCTVDSFIINSAESFPRWRKMFSQYDDYGIYEWKFDGFHYIIYYMNIIVIIIGKREKNKSTSLACQII
jgi:hypothetical protein